MLSVNAGFPDIVNRVEADLKKTAARIVDKAKAMCNAKSVTSPFSSLMVHLFRK